MSLQSAMAFIAACRSGGVDLAAVAAGDPAAVRPALFARARTSGYDFSQTEFERALRLDILARLAPAYRSSPGAAGR
ncbi:hypothetical protein ABIE65_004068 [Constrictibacter sp. MBR-5]|jgi:hypothetical protein|uniref:hypothetical protein n=1 Tax=Constrictibacter sp. MBR-5 TaxID=3156467 RepID=UPI003391824C